MSPNGHWHTITERKENMKSTIKVAGTTFVNKDGVNRQDIIHNLGTGWKTAKLKQTTYDGKRAVEVRIAGQLIGYVPKTQLGNPLSHESELTAFVDYYPPKNINDDGKWYVVLSERSVPSSAEYAYMKKLCIKAGRPMPAYDKRAYASYWAVVKA